MSSILLHGADAGQVASLRLVLEAGLVNENFRLSPRLRRRGFQLEQDHEPGRAQLLLTPPQRMPIEGIGRGPILRVKDPSELRFAGVEYGSVEGQPLQGEAGVGR